MLRGYFSLSPEGRKTLERYPIGGFAEYTLSPDANVAKIPDSVSFETAARLGYMGTSYAGLKKGKVGPGSTVLINGVTGTLGYAAVAIALALGAVKIIGVGRNKERLAQVKSLAPGRVEVVSTEEEDNVPGWVQKVTNGQGPDAIYDCLGVGGDADTTNKLIDTVRRGGEAVLVAGGSEGNITQSYWEAMGHNVGIRGSMWFTPGEIDELIALIGAGAVDVSFLKHEEFSLDNVNEALKMVGDRPGGAVNVVVKP